MGMGTTQGSLPWHWCMGMVAVLGMGIVMGIPTRWLRGPSFEAMHIRPFLRYCRQHAKHMPSVLSVTALRVLSQRDCLLSCPTHYHAQLPHWGPQHACHATTWVSFTPHAVHHGHHLSPTSLQALFLMTQTSAAHNSHNPPPQRHHLTRLLNCCPIAVGIPIPYAG